MRGALGSLMALVVSLAVGFGAIEAVVRLAFNDGTNFDIEMWRYARDMKRVSPIPGVGHEHRPNVEGVYMGVPVRTNSMGLRDREIALQRSPGLGRILMLGDSVTFGWGERVEGTTSKLLEGKLNGDGAKRWEVVNTGVGNWNTAMQVDWFLAKGKDFRPDIVVLNYFVNDAEPTPARKGSWLLERSYAAVFVAGRFDVLMRSADARADWREYYLGLYDPALPGWRQARAKIAELAAWCRANGVRLLVANYPELRQFDDYPFAKATAMVAAEAAANGVPFVDLMAAVTDVRDYASLWVTPTDSHPNAKAADRYAGLLRETLRQRFPDLF